MHGWKSLLCIGLLFVFLILTPLTAVGEAYHEHAKIRQAVEDFVLEYQSSAQGQIVVKVGQIDSRLRLHNCGDNLELFTPSSHGSPGRLTVGVRCHDARSWTIYVPVDLQVYRKVVVTTHPLTRGQLVGPNDVRLENRDIGRLTQGFITNTEDVIGQSVRRPVGHKQVIRPTHIAPRAVIRRGQRVTILASSGTLEVRMSGEALADGAPGEPIKIRNSTTDRVIEAIVQGPGVVKVKL